MPGSFPVIMHQLLTVKEGRGWLYAVQGWVHSGCLRRLHIIQVREAYEVPKIEVGEVHEGQGML